jgi:hypothetical protein
MAQVTLHQKLERARGFVLDEKHRETLDPEIFLLADGGQMIRTFTEIWGDALPDTGRHSGYRGHVCVLEVYGPGKSPGKKDDAPMFRVSVESKIAYAHLMAIFEQYGKEAASKYNFRAHGEQRSFQEAMAALDDAFLEKWLSEKDIKIGRMRKYDWQTYQRDLAQFKAKIHLALTRQEAIDLKGRVERAPWRSNDEMKNMLRYIRTTYRAMAIAKGQAGVTDSQMRQLDADIPTPHLPPIVVVPPVAPRVPKRTKTKRRVPRKRAVPKEPVVSNGEDHTYTNTLDALADKICQVLLVAKSKFSEPQESMTTSGLVANLKECGYTFTYGAPNTQLAAAIRRHQDWFLRNTSERPFTIWLSTPGKAHAKSLPPL